MPSLTHAIQHHAKTLEPIVGILATGILTELQPLGWKTYHYRSGANSWGIVKGVHKQFHFRSRSTGTITVLDNYYHGNVVCVIKSRGDAWRFIRDVKKGKL
jgi:hypothetical protein